MSGKNGFHGLWIILAAMLLAIMGCVLGSKEQSYENDAFSLTIPAGWSVHEGPSDTGKNGWDYLRMNLKILLEIKGRTYTPRVTITSRELPAGSDLRQEFDATYAHVKNSTRNKAEGSGTLDGKDALVMRYDMPLGEPWYHFEDTWMVKNGLIYVISCQGRLDPTEEDLAGCTTILKSFSLK